MLKEDLMFEKFGENGSLFSERWSQLLFFLKNKNMALLREVQVNKICQSCSDPGRFVMGEGQLKTALTNIFFLNPKPIFDLNTISRYHSGIKMFSREWGRGGATFSDGGSGLSNYFLP